MFVEEKAKGEVKELDTVRKLLLKAAALIEDRGLTKGHRMNEGGSMCIAGAIAFAETGNAEKDGPNYQDACDLLIAQPEFQAAGCTTGPALWNNAPERTAQEVIAKLRAVALSR